MTIAILITFLARFSLVMLFLPFSALDKVLNFQLATVQAGEAVVNRTIARGLIASGFLIEVVMSLGVMTGIADRFAAFILAGYCAVTALLWKQFWRQRDFRLKGQSAGRDMFWDFLKNFAVAGGFLMLAFGPDAGSASLFLHAPFDSTQPYAPHRIGVDR